MPIYSLFKPFPHCNLGTIVCGACIAQSLCRFVGKHREKDADFVEYFCTSAVNLAEDVKEKAIDFLQNAHSAVKEQGKELGR